MKILLINPGIVESNFTFKPDFIVNLEPLGLEYLAGMLLAGHEIEILDGLGTGLTNEQIITTLGNFKPDIIGISLSYSKITKSAKEIAKIIKKHSPDLPVVFGGNAATFTAQDLIKEPYVDIIVLGEGEITFKELIKKWEEGSMKYEVGSGKCESQIPNLKSQISSIPGLCYKTSDGEIKLTPKRPLIEHLDSLALPAHSILKNKIYYKRTVSTTRGCPYNCIYCSASAFFKKYRERSISNVMKEIESLFNADYSYIIKGISFIDDIFTFNQNRVKELCWELSNLRDKLNLKENFSWECSTRMENITEDLLKTMKDAGCERILFGIESGSPKILKRLNRKYTPDDVITVTKLCKNLGISPVTSFILGLPYETKEDLDLTFSLISRKKGPTGLSILTAFPGTEIFNNPQKYDLTIFAHLPEDAHHERAWIENNYLTREEITKAYYDARYFARSLKKNK